MKMWTTFLVGFMCFLGNVAAQVSVSWAKSYDKFATKDFKFIKLGNDFILIGAAKEEKNSIYLTKINASGKLMWTKDISLNYKDIINNVTVLNENKLIISAKQNCSEFSCKNTLFICFDLKNQIVVWQLSIKNDKRTGDSNVFIKNGSIYLLKRFNMDILTQNAKMTKINENGKIVFEKDINEKNQGEIVGFSEDKHGCFWILKLVDSYQKNKWLGASPKFIQIDQNGRVIRDTLLHDFVTKDFFWQFKIDTLYD